MKHYVTVCKSFTIIKTQPLVSKITKFSIDNQVLLPREDQYSLEILEIFDFQTINSLENLRNINIL